MYFICRHQDTKCGIKWRFTQMMCYNVYVPLLIWQANDVEESPGPTIFDTIDPMRTVSADYGPARKWSTLWWTCWYAMCSNAIDITAVTVAAVIYYQIEHISEWTFSTFKLKFFLTIGINQYVSMRYSVQANDYLLLNGVQSMCCFTLQQGVYITIQWVVNWKIVQNIK